MNNSEFCSAERAYWRIFTLVQILSWWGQHSITNEVTARSGTRKPAFRRRIKYKKGQANNRFVSDWKLVFLFSSHFQVKVSEHKPFGAQLFCKEDWQKKGKKYKYSSMAQKKPAHWRWQMDRTLVLMLNFIFFAIIFFIADLKKTFEQLYQWDCDLL